MLPPPTINESVLRCPRSALPAQPLLCPLSFHALTLTLLKASWRRAQALVAARLPAIKAVAEALQEAPDERLEGAALLEIIQVGAAGWLAGWLAAAAAAVFL